MVGKIGISCFGMAPWVTTNRKMKQALVVEVLSAWRRRWSRWVVTWFILGAGWGVVWETVDSVVNCEGGGDSTPWWPLLGDAPSKLCDMGNPRVIRTESSATTLSSTSHDLLSPVTYLMPSRYFVNMTFQRVSQVKSIDQEPGWQMELNWQRTDFGPILGQWILWSRELLKEFLAAHNTLGGGIVYYQAHIM